MLLLQVPRKEDVAGHCSYDDEQKEAAAEGGTTTGFPLVPICDALLRRVSIVAVCVVGHRLCFGLGGI